MAMRLARNVARVEKRNMYRISVNKLEETR
jgi:hypothetical protein